MSPAVALPRLEWSSCVRSAVHVMLASAMACHGFTRAPSPGTPCKDLKGRFESMALRLSSAEWHVSFL